ncbi:MAG: DUF3179 domain-containing protein [Sphingomonadales bacterium]
MIDKRYAFSLVALALILWTAGSADARGQYAAWQKQWPSTDFSKHSVPLDEIVGGGPPKDGIPSIDRPVFAPLSDIEGLADAEPVITVEIKGYTRAYPLRILIWHEIVNDEIAGVPVAVTYCPLCDSAIVFDRRVDGQVLEFGTTGKVRHADLVMYDRQTESWWQQFVGEAIVGEMTGAVLKMIPARVESVARFRERGPRGLVLVPSRMGLRQYGASPYADYDTRRRPLPHFFQGAYPKGIAPMARVVRIGRHAWPLKRLRKEQRIEHGNLILTWAAGQNSALDEREIIRGRDIGNVVVQRQTENGLEDAVYDVTFAFAFNAFYPDGTLHSR